MSGQRNSWFLCPVLFSVAASVVVAGGVVPSLPDAITVCSSGCDYTSIQRAAYAAGDGQTILLGPETFYESGILIPRPLTIRGAGVDRTILDGMGRDVLFFVYLPPYAGSHEPLRLTDMTIQKGGQGVYGARGPVVLERCIIQDNNSEWPSAVGGVRASILTIRDSVIRNNRAEGDWCDCYDCRRPPWCPSLAGGVFGSDVVITNTVIEGNSADWIGGIYSYRYGGGNHIRIESSKIQGNTGGVAGGLGTGGGPAVVTIESSEFRDNEGLYSGGLYTGGETEIHRTAVVDNKGGGVTLGTTAVITNSTIAQNLGRGVWLGGYAAETFRIDSSTIVDNTEAGIVLVGSNANDVQLSIHGTIVAGNAASQCEVLAGEIVSTGHNISSDLSCPFMAPGDLENEDPILLPLGDYGGPTSTCPPHPDSPAIDAGGETCPPTDQRGVPRPLDGDFDGEAECDIGAFELGIRGDVKVIRALQDLLMEVPGADGGLATPLQSAIAVLSDADIGNDVDALRRLTTLHGDLAAKSDSFLDPDQARAFRQAVQELLRLLLEM